MELLDCLELFNRVQTILILMNKQIITELYKIYITLWTYMYNHLTECNEMCNIAMIRIREMCICIKCS